MTTNYAKNIAPYSQLFNQVYDRIRGVIATVALRQENYYMCDLIPLCDVIVAVEDDEFFNRFHGWGYPIEMCNDISNLSFMVDEAKRSGKKTIIGISYNSNDDKDIINVIKGVTMKFDLILGNPPYGDKYNVGLHLKIHKVFSELLTETGSIVFVHPSRYLLSHKDGVTLDKDKDINVDKIESVHLIWGNKMFAIGLFVPVGVTIWRNDKTNKVIEVVDDAFTGKTYKCEHSMIHIYGEKYPYFKKWVSAINMGTIEIKVGKKGKTKTVNDSIKNHGEKILTKKYGFVIGTLRGTPPRSGTDEKLKDDFFTIIPKEEKFLSNNYINDSLWESPDYPRGFSFDTEEERTNFVNYLKTKSVRFILSLTKTAKSLHDGELNQIPWMDFTKSYSDKELRVLWNIDDTLWEFIDKNIPDYYPDYHFDGIYCTRR